MSALSTVPAQKRTMKSAIYEGVVRHRRTDPVDHQFRYRLFMMYLDLEELPELFSGCPGWGYERKALASFRRQDYFGPEEVPLAEAVRDEVERRSGHRPRGPIRMLTNLRYFGYCFNPVTFYYCFDAAGERVETILAEITNTPWGERHAYVMTSSEVQGHAKEGAASSSLAFGFRKIFHVSPFIDMDVDYVWRFSAPGSRGLLTYFHSNDVGRWVIYAYAAEGRASQVLALSGTTRAVLLGVLGSLRFETLL